MKSFKQKSGMMMIVTALIILVVLALLGLALSTGVGGLANQTSAYSSLILMDQAAFEVAGAVFQSLAKSLKNPEDTNFKTLLKGSSSGDLSATWPISFNIAEANDLRIVINDIEVSYKTTKKIGSADKWLDPWEKLFELTLHVDISAGRSRFRMFRRRYHFTRQGKVHRLILPLLSKFTLFIRQPEQTDEQNSGYNCFDNFVDGEVGQTSRVYPLRLNNGSAHQKEDVLNAGWIFLGGDREIQLHATSGNHINNGELFQFHSITSPEKSPPMFEFNQLPGTPVFNNGAMFLDSAIKATVKIRGTYFGFYKWDKKLGSDMNKQGILQRYFSSAQSRTMSSNALHLTGTYDSPSPTIVVGKVKRVFAYYSGLIYSANGEGGSAKFLDMLESPPVVVTDDNQQSFWQTVNLERVFSGEKFARDKLEFSALEVNAEKLFATSANYLKFASNLVIEPYNRVYDYMYNDSGQLPPPEKFSKKTGFSYEISGENLQLKDGLTDELLFNGNCNTFSSEDLVRDRVNVVIKDQESFFDLFKEENTLNLDRNVILVKGPLELPDNLEILSPGIIFVEGDITLKGGIKKCETGNLSLVSLGGDIIIGAVNQEIWAHLATLDGTIYPNNNNPVKIYGALAADKIDLAGNANGQRKWAGGGDLVYDSRLNPAQEDRDSSYAINLADFYDNFSIEKMANEFPENIN